MNTALAPVSHHLAPLPTETPATSQGVFPGPVARKAIKPVIICDDPEVGQSAMQAAARLLNKAIGEDDTKTVLWHFNLLEYPNWQVWATADVLNSDLLIIATHTETALPDSVTRWLKYCFAQKPEMNCAVIALFGRPGNYDGAQSLRLRLVRQIVEGAGLNFFAPGIQNWGIRHLVTANLHAREEAVTPTLDRILHLADRPAH